MKKYIAVIHKDSESDYGVSFPDFPGCITAGSTLDEAKKMAEDALDFHIRGMIEDGEEIPEPSFFESLIVNPDFSGAAAFIVVAVSLEDMLAHV